MRALLLIVALTAPALAGDPAVPTVTCRVIHVRPGDTNALVELGVRKPDGSAVVIPAGKLPDFTDPLQLGRTSRVLAAPTLRPKPGEPLTQFFGQPFPLPSGESLFVGQTMTVTATPDPAGTAVAVEFADTASDGLPTGIDPGWDRSAESKRRPVVRRVTARGAATLAPGGTVALFAGTRARLDRRAPNNAIARAIYGTTTDWVDEDVYVLVTVGAPGE